jgi:hypothetical protein
MSPVWWLWVDGMAIGMAVVGYNNARTMPKEGLFAWFCGFNVYNAYP